MKRILAVLALLLCASPVFGQYTITTVAGIGLVPGDGGPATKAQFFDPYGMAFDSAGNLYIADRAQNRVRMVTPDGTITTVAGNGLRGYSGDGGPATDARLDGPIAAVEDASGNLFIAEGGGKRIREVTPDGTIATIAADAGIGRVAGLAVSADGSLYISDSGNHKVLQMLPDGTIATVAGTGTAGYNGDDRPAAEAQLSSPQGIAIDSNGNLYIADQGNFRIRRVAGDGTIQTFAGTGVNGSDGDGGPAIKARLHNVLALAVDGAGNVYVSDSNRVREIAGGNVNTIAGAGQQTPMPGTTMLAAQTSLPPINGMACDGSGQLYLSLYFMNVIVRVGADGNASAVYGALHMGDGDNNASSVSLFMPDGVMGAGGGAVLVVDQMNFRLLLIAPSGDVTTVAQPPQVVAPAGLTYESAHNVYVADIAQQVIFHSDSTGKLSLFAGGGADASEGVPATKAALNLTSPTGMATDRDGNFYFSQGNDVVRRVARDGTVSTVAGFAGHPGFGGDYGPAKGAHLAGPMGLAVDVPGNLYIADAGNGRIRKISPDGRMTTFAGPDPLLQTPTGLAVDPAGNLFVADQGSNRILKITPDGKIQSIAGTGEWGFGGDGGDANAAVLASPQAVDVVLPDRGVLYFADTYNHRIRMLTPR